MVRPTRKQTPNSDNISMIIASMDDREVLSRNTIVVNTPTGNVLYTARLNKRR